MDLDIVTRPFTDKLFDRRLVIRALTSSLHFAKLLLIFANLLSNTKPNIVNSVSHVSSRSGQRMLSSVMSSNVG